MEFKLFENKTDPIEYLQIFIYQKIHVKSENEIDIDEYSSFELTDTLIESYNNWISNSEHINSTTDNWLNSNSDKATYFIENFQTKFKPKVSIWSDRIKTPYYKDKLQASFIFENYIAALISEKYNLDLGQYLTPEGQYKLGENALGIEIKNDTLINKYGNVYIEYQEKSNSNNYNYIDSGILKNDNCVYFLTGTIDKFYIFRKEILIKIFHEEALNNKNFTKSSRGILFKQIATSKGYVYPIINALHDTITMETMIAEIKTQL